MPPWRGQGANTGVADVHNLSWKLSYVLQGFASPSLLDTYQVCPQIQQNKTKTYTLKVERHPVDYLCAQESAEGADSTGLMDINTLVGENTTSSSPLLPSPNLFSFRSRLPRMIGFGSQYTNLVCTNKQTNKTTTKY